MCLLNLFRPQPQVKPIEYQCDWPTIQAELDRIGVPHYDAWDSKYYYTDFNYWKYIIGIVRQNLPSYTAEKFDCDKFSVLLAARVYEKFQFNTIGICIGESPFGYHSWSCFYTPDGLYYLEPQDGSIWKADTGDYKADYILFA